MYHILLSKLIDHLCSDRQLTVKISLLIIQSTLQYVVRHLTLSDEQHPMYVLHLLNDIVDYLQTIGQEIISNLSSTFTIVYWL